MSNPSAISAIAFVAIRQLLEQRHRQRRVAERDGAERERDRRAGRVLRRHAESNERLRGFGVTGDGERAKAGGGAAQQFLEAGILVRELQRVDEIALVRLAVDVEQADRGGDRRLRGLRRGR